MTETPSKKAAPASAPGDEQRAVRFELAAPAGSKVYVAGSFNNWETTQLPLRENPHPGHFAVTLPLPRGRHEYKFIVNGCWCADPKCAQTTPNGRGSLNSVLEI